jgi:toxin CcdB
MAQYDVHRNLGRHKDTIPFVVIVQSSRFDGYRRRVVAPLVRTASSNVPYTPLHPAFTIDDIRVVLNPLEILSVATEQLGPHVGNLADSGNIIMSALDELFSQAWK